MVFGWLQIVMVIVVVGVLAGAFVTAVMWQRWLTALDRLAPRTRFQLLVAVALIPVFTAAGAVGVSFAPSVLDAVGLVPDHCGHHAGHAFHLCFIHGRPPAMSLGIFAAATAGLVWFATQIGTEAQRHVRARKWAKDLRRTSQLDAALDAHVFPGDRPFAVTIGLWNPKLFVSQALEDLLSAEQFDAVLAHERAHARRRDGLFKSMARVGAALQFPQVRTALLAAIDVACEQACDESASQSIGDRLTVAEALLTVERALGSQTPPSGALAFGRTALEARVRNLADAPEWERPASWSIAALLIPSTIAVVLYYDVIHHAVESALAVLF